MDGKFEIKHISVDGSSQEKSEKQESNCTEAGLPVGMVDIAPTDNSALRQESVEKTKCLINKSSEKVTVTRARRS